MNIERIPVSAVSVIAALALVAVGAAVGPVTAVAPSAATIVVDDDGAQCVNADYRSIADAVTAAPAGATVEVCPGLYRERVEIDKPLNLVGQPDSVDAIDCFDPTWTATTPLDTSALPVIERPLDDILSDPPAPLLRLNADGVEVAGLAVLSMAQPHTDDSIYTAAIQADGKHAGHRIHNNLIQGNGVPIGQPQDNTLGIELGSDGTTDSRVDHNCLRGNTWALANQQFTAASVRIDHNDTYRQGHVAYEIGLPDAGTSDVRLDHNRSVSVGSYAFAIDNSDRIRVDDNVAVGSRGNAFRIGASTAVRLDHNTANGGVGVVVLPGNKGVEISDNQLTGGTAGIVTLGGTVPVANPSTGVVVDGNSVQGYTANGIQLSNNANTSDVVITDNVVRENLSGIQIGRTNSGALVKNNVSDSNAADGIRTVPGVRGNSFVTNSMHHNAGVDAFEGTVDADRTLGNTWTDNVCEKDNQAGAICTSP